MAKFRVSAKLGGFTEEMLGSLKLIISFGKEHEKLEEYKALAHESYEVAKKSAILNGFMGGSFFACILYFSCFSWVIGYLFIKYEIENPRYDRLTSVSDIVLCY